ncbi:MAG: cupin domain-containing protein [Xanthomonadales bacterium]|nr:cupin domain-containing protein [Xanthomonadales bacterium]
MSETVETQQDPLSTLLRQLNFRAEVFFRAEYCGRWAVDTSGSNQVPFHLVAHGEGWLHGDNSPPRRLLPGHLVVFPHDASHLLAASETAPDPLVVNQGPPDRIDQPATRLICGYFKFDRQAAAPLLAGLPPTLLLNLADVPHSGARDLVYLWMREAAEDRLGGDVAVDRLAELVFIEMLRIEADAGRLAGVFSALGDARLGPILAAIHQNPGASHSIEEMAAASSLSESAFAQRFKKAVGMTPGQYVKHWRLQTAAQALRESRRSMGDIAASVGYESEVAFRKAFSAHFGNSPGRYRREAQSLGHQ